MKNLLITFLMVMILSGVIAAQEVQGPLESQAVQKLKVGVVNSDMVLQNYPEFRRAEEQLGREVEGWRAERTSWEADMERLGMDVSEREGKLAKGLNILSETKKADLRRQIDSLKMDYQERMNRQMTMEQQRLQTRRAELLSGVLETVNDVIEEIGEANGFDFILDTSNGSIVYAKDTEDITDLLLRHLEDK